MLFKPKLIVMAWKLKIIQGQQQNGVSHPYVARYSQIYSIPSFLQCFFNSFFCN